MLMYDPLHDHNPTPRIFQQETAHNMEELQAHITQIQNRLNHEQQTVIRTVMRAWNRDLMIALDAIPMLYLPLPPPVLISSIPEDTPESSAIAADQVEVVEDDEEEEEEAG